ncbi:MAG: hypothetical protein A2W31_16675 [Planctomycetes bacterium RBG_16_64_10]|nr:MAG: hypothetical protein A2W31_16675 [Planctomycetes bacterium RBG_16_64_10]
MPLVACPPVLVDVPVLGMDYSQGYRKQVKYDHDLGNFHELTFSSFERPLPIVPGSESHGTGGQATSGTRRPALLC